MRACALWFFTALIIALTSISEAAAKPVTKTDTILPSRLWTDSLVDDEPFRRDGVISDMKTCLLVAADMDALELWHGSDNSHWRNLERDDRPALADLLYRLEPEKKEAAGYGTILVCSQILLAWHTKLPDSENQSESAINFDGRKEHGAIVIDLGFEEKRTRVKPVPLLRLLTSPQLLPRWAFGGIVIRNAIIDGTLLLHNLHLNLPLAFVNVQFVGGRYRKDLYEVDREIEAAISILHSRFQDHILISNSEICGKVLINDSQFDEKFDWRNVTQQALNPANGSADRFGRDCVDHRQAEKPPALKIHASTFSQSLRILYSTFGELKIVSTTISRLLTKSTSFGRKLSLSDSDIGSIQMSGDLADIVAINYNRISNDFFISGHKEMKGNINSVNINSNRVGGGIGFNNFPQNILPKTISLESNHVGNGSLLCVPEGWLGTLSLDGSSYDGKLAIGLTKPPEEEDTQLEDDVVGLKCSWTSWMPRRFVDSDDTYCEDQEASVHPEEGLDPSGVQDIMKVTLEAVDVRTLVWQLPLECNYRWSGFGLRYRLWQPADNAAKTISEQVGDRNLSQLRVFRAWRTTLWSHEPAPLDTMSRYLSENGAYADSRKLLLEAKRLNYVPDCKPDRWVFTCAGIMIKDLFGKGWQSVKSIWPTKISKAEAAIDDEATPRQSIFESLGTSAEAIVGSVYSWLESFSMLFILWPGGYGAKPERAIFLMLIAATSFWVVYRYYCYRLLHELAAIPSLSIGDPVHGRVSASDLIDQWPSKEDWLNDSPIGIRPKSVRGFVLDAFDRLRSMGRQRREPEENEWLEQVQGPLLDAVKAKKGNKCSLSESKKLQLVALQQKLELFGNTDILGFSRFEGNRMPKRFTTWQYSIDTMLPVIDLHAYSSYYPESGWMRFTSVFQHFVGWWLTTVFIASAAIL